MNRILRIITLQVNISELFSGYPKDIEGNKIFGAELQRANGRCELVLPLICIAHPGVAVLMVYYRSGRKATLQVKSC